MLNDSEIAVLDAAIVRIGTFIAENSYPPAEPADVVQAFRDMAADVQRANDFGCLLKAEDAHRGIEVIASGELELDEMLAVPRLPVSNPSCM
jgi:hypothetical protein